jgi:hypothetical protein
MAGNNGVRVTLFAMTFAACTSCAFGPRGGGGLRETVGIEFVAAEPPRERVEQVPDSPGKEDVWMKGSWARNGDDYRWVSGRWERPAAGFHEWVPGRWDHESRGWYFVEGHWA